MRAKNTEKSGCGVTAGDELRLCSQGSVQRIVFEPLGADTS
jgi:hypothetical protein